MAAANELMRDIDQFFEGPNGPPKFDLTEAHHGIKGFVLHTDFSLSRPAMPLVPANSTFVNGVATKDVVIDKETNIRARIFLPEILDSCKSKLPLIFYFHGGGFVALSVDSQMFHDFCDDICRSVKAIVVSVDYRLAPEYRLPGQYEDARVALEWLRLHADRCCKVEEDAAGTEHEATQELKLVSAAPSEDAVVSELESAPEPQSGIHAQAPVVGSNSQHVDSESRLEPWLISHADFNRLFLLGDSAGGNIVHNLFVESPPENFEPLHLSGLILLQPAFGGLNRTPAELSAAQELPCSLDFFWKLALPLEADRSHHYCDVFPKLNDLLHKKQLSFPDIFMVVGGRDSLRDWQLLYCETLKKFDTKMKLVNYDEAFHGFYAFRHHELADNLLKELAQFVRGR